MSSAAPSTRSPASASAWRVRPAAVDDVAFIASTWKQNFWRESHWGRRIRWAVFAPSHAVIIQRLLERSLVLVACDPEREEEILGYLVFELVPIAGAVHFAYVKPAFRHAGVLRSLLADSGLPPDLADVQITHATWSWLSSPGKPGIEEKFPKAVHDPYRAFFPDGRPDLSQRNEGNS